MNDFAIKDRYDMDDYRALIRCLRGPEGCPWDRVQTHESIRRNLLEEAYEAAHAIDSGDKENLREELGDLLMQVLLHAQMEEEQGGFDLDDVADTACKKLVFRHPHVFADAAAADPNSALETWEARKRTEKGQSTVTESMVSVPENLPALWRAEKVQKKAAAVGFEWPDASWTLVKLREETEELAAGMAAGDRDNIFEELGDVLFCAVNAARMQGMDPEAALHAACGKFIRRFAYLEQKAAENGENIREMSISELEKYYQEARTCLEGKEKQFYLDKSPKG
jgi:tetrapyrrole methylase family protein/MazG family protein